jgi:ketosteroid isomerase-like protein
LIGPLPIFKSGKVAVILLKTPLTEQTIYVLRGAKPMNQVEQTIRALEEDLTQTEMRVDVEALDRIYADDIMVTAPIGICVDKPAVMHEVREAAGKATVERYDKADLKVRAYGDEAAVTSYRIDARAKFEGTDIIARFCITNVWIKRGGSWQIVARHTANLDQPAQSATEALGSAV